ncbi:dihydropteroate synthase [Defluviimonas sp. WL0075]|uniref:Dihydropteroate synthase n=1 Tax=Albidovulum sediminicola TaxID=2984331 RepID=A0ABT2Z1E3_9RHOB|nr:dihydropteroate synthase [Defluviimonas sp. WL0075]MCV2864941.1 dihydropteroate synthase [Defluviimonas sp. WL0075]
MEYFRPIAMTDPARPEGALQLAGGWCWFDRAEVLTREGPQRTIPASEIPEEAREALTALRPDFLGMGLGRPRIMGVLNVTPDSFSDGGLFAEGAAAREQGLSMALAGAEIIDIGGESTRPGAADVAIAEETDRTAPVIAALRRAGVSAPISIDTRKAAVACAALDAGAAMVNDVSAFAYDAALGHLVAAREVPVCLMHAQGVPATMQHDPRYANVLLDVYDYLAECVREAEAVGIPRARILVDPGIGFGKNLEHNLALLRGLSLFHGLGCGILLGASRKRFIGTIGGAETAADRGPGTIAVTLAGIAQGVQWHRVHDIGETRQAIRLWQAVTAGDMQ